MNIFAFKMCKATGYAIMHKLSVLTMKFQQPICNIVDSNFSISNRYELNNIFYKGY